MIDLRRPRAALTTAGAVALETAAVVGLSRLGARREFAIPFSHLDEWLRATPPADALVAVLRWVALLGAWWLLGGTLLYLVAAATRIPGAVRAVRWAALPPVRRVIDTTCAVTVVAGAVFAPAAGAAPPDPPSTTAVRDGRTATPTSRPAAPATAPAPAPDPSRSPEPTPEPEPADGGSLVVIAPGDNLWELTARRLAAATGRARADVGDAEIGPAWVELCDLNRGTLASGDPNVVFPGEVVVFPPLS